jgi:hypothetical protein
MIERMNKTLCERLRIYCQQIDNWDENTKELIIGINSSINKITQKSPLYLMHEFEPRVRLLNEWNIDSSKVFTNIEEERLDSNSQTIEE